MENGNIHHKYLPWVEKFRPSTLDDIKDQSTVIKTIKNFLDPKHIHNFPHLLFVGESGTGKTSTIMACVKQIYGVDYYGYMTIKINASMDRGIDIVRDRIKSFINNRTSMFLPKDKQDIFKVVIMDEVDSMTPEAQGILRSMIESSSKSTRFCLICNKIDKINTALKSRCSNFRFLPLSKELINERLHEICKIEKLKINQSIIDAIIKISDGDLRKAINQLQTVSMNTSSDSSIYKVLGLTHPEILEFIYKNLQLPKKSDEIFTDIWEKYQNQNITITVLLNELSNKIIVDKKIDVENKIKIIIDISVIERHESINIKTEFLFKHLIAVFNNIFGYKAKEKIAKGLIRKK